MTTGSGTCDRWREALSAQADGEDPAVSTRLIDAHVARCGACREFAAAIAPTAPGHRVPEAPPDLSRQVARLAGVADRAGSWTIVRGLLAVVAIEIIVFSVPDLVLGDNPVVAAHSARHLGAFTAAYGVGLLVVVIRPARARTMLPVAAVLAGALLVTATADLLNGRVPLVHEAQHLREVISVVLVWLIAVPSPRRRDRAARRNPARPELSVVAPEDRRVP